MKTLISALLILSCGSTVAQYQRQQFDAPYGTQGRPIQLELETVGTVMSVHAEQMEVTAGYNCPDGFVAPEQSIVNPGTIGGALLGGAAANHLGKGKGKTAATVAGAAIGGMAGNEVYKRLNDAEDRDARRAPGMPGECYEVKKWVPVYVHRLAIRGLNLSGGDRAPIVEMTNVRSFTKYAVGQQVPAKVQINYFVSRLD
jgi:hypothetical protein